MPAPIDAVTFDYWNTLVYEEHGQLRGIRLQSWTAILRTPGSTCRRSGWRRRSTTPGRSTSARGSTIASTCTTRPWRTSFARSASRRPTTWSGAGRSFPRAADGADLHLTDGIEDCLRALRSAGVRIGIVCDVGMTPSSSLISCSTRAASCGSSTTGRSPTRSASTSLTRRSSGTRSPASARRTPPAWPTSATYADRRRRRARHGHVRRAVHGRVRRRRRGSSRTHVLASHADLCADARPG